MCFIQRLAQVTDNAIVQCAVALGVIGVGSDENCRDRVPNIDEASEEFETAHHRHLNVADQAGSFAETGGCEKIGCRGESFHGVTQ
jgi:hypothetical protein